MIRTPLTTSFAALALAALCCLGASHVAKAAEASFEEKTTTLGGVPADLSGVWLLVTHLNIAADKYGTYAELLRVSQQDHGGPTVHLLDVSLPKDMDTELK